MPQGQAAVTANSLRDDPGIFPGVRVAADERTSQVIVQAPPEVIAHRPATGGGVSQLAAGRREAGGGRG